MTFAPWCLVTTNSNTISTDLLVATLGQASFGLRHLVKRFLV